MATPIQYDKPVRSSHNAQSTRLNTYPVNCVTYATSQFIPDKRRIRNTLITTRCSLHRNFAYAYLDTNPPGVVKY